MNLPSIHMRPPIPTLTLIPTTLTVSHPDVLPRLNAPMNDGPDLRRAPELSENMFEDANRENEPKPAVADVDLDDLAPGFRESRAVRLLYLQTVIGRILGSMIVLDSNNALADGLDLIGQAASVSDTAPTHTVKPAKYW